jgi:hypothetical protein
MGCQPWSVACKMIWTREKGEEHQWWCTVNTQPGLGTPKGWERMGGGYDADGNVVLGKLPSTEEFGGAWRFNHNAVFFGGYGRSVHLAPSGDGGGAPTWGPNWDEDQGGGAFAHVMKTGLAPVWVPSPVATSGNGGSGWRRFSEQSQNRASSLGRRRFVGSRSITYAILNNGPLPLRLRNVLAPCEDLCQRFWTFDFVPWAKPSLR